MKPINTSIYDQCREKRYADAYAADGRRVVYVGVNYDPAVRTVDTVKTEPAEFVS